MMDFHISNIIRILRDSLSSTSIRLDEATLAQLGERQTEDLKVVCSIHTGRSLLFSLGHPEWLSLVFFLIFLNYFCGDGNCSIRVLAVLRYFID